MITPKRMTRKIILVAPDAQLRMALGQALSNQGYRRLLVLDFPEVLTQAVDTQSHLCIICLEQGGNNWAMRTARRIRRETSVTSFIFIGQATGEETELSQFDHVDLQVLPRPFSMLAFIAAVDRALQRYVPRVSASSVESAETGTKPR